MDAILVDINGNKKNFLYQYDKGQYLIIENFEYSIAPKIHFQIKTIATAISEQSTLQENTLKCLIPNSLLAYGEDITAYIYIEDDEKEYVTETIFISVVPRKRPSNYSEAVTVSWEKVTNKPELFAPDQHAISHHVGGIDELKAFDIGAAEKVHSHNDLYYTENEIDEFVNTINEEISNLASSTHTHTKDEVGLNNVDNTSDMDKPISTATQNALDTKMPLVDGKIPISLLPDEIFHNLVLTDASYPDKQYTLGVDNGKLQLILIETTTESSDSTE